MLQADGEKSVTLNTKCDSVRCLSTASRLSIWYYCCQPPCVSQSGQAALPGEYLYEPAPALSAVEDGTDIVRRILAGAGKFLKRGGIISKFIELTD